jgi:hypothetical protein
VRTGQWPAFDPNQTVLLDAEADASEVPPADPAPSERPARVRMTHYENTVVEIEVLSDSAGFVVLNDVWHPWWQAQVDGQEVRILKANVLFRAVPITAGRHKVRFEFQPLTGALVEFADRMLGVNE